MKDQLLEIKANLETTIVVYSKILKSFENKESREYYQLNDQLTTLMNYLGYISSEILTAD